MKNKFIEMQRIESIIKEIEASCDFIKEGLRIFKNTNSTYSNNHVVLQLLSSGFERLMKILLLLKYKQVNGDFPKLEEGENNFFRKYDNGHGIKKMLDEMMDYADNDELMINNPMIIEDFNFIRTDKFLNKFLEIITEFSKNRRYYYIDRIVNPEIKKSNPFGEFTGLIDSYLINTDNSEMTYNEEEEFIKTSMIITIEKGVRAINRFFTHGLGEDGKKYYGEFSDFILLEDADLGKLNYLKPKIDPNKDYKPMGKNEFRSLKIRLLSKTKVVKRSDFDSWPFIINKVKVLNYKDGRYLFVLIGRKIYALSSNTTTHFKIPIYYVSEKIKPKHTLPKLFEIAKEL